MLTYLFDLKANKVVEINIPLDERESLVSGGRYRLATPLERVDFVRNRPKENNYYDIPEGLIDVQFVSPRNSNDGYSTVGEFMEKYAKNNGIFLNRFYTGQKIGILYNHPRHINLLKTPYKILYTGFESTKLPQDWIQYLEQFDEIWTFSKFCQKAFKDLGFEAKLMYHGIDTNEFPLLERSRAIDKPFTLLHYDAFKWRKGWDLVLGAFDKAFGDKKDVRLVLKTTREKIFPIDYPNVVIKKGKYSKERMLKLLQDSDAFVFPSRGEGFGMTPLEAMSTGLPAIVTNEHAIKEYFNHEFMLGVKGKKIPAKYDSEIFRGQDTGEMFEADVDKLAEEMVYMYELWKNGRFTEQQISNYAKKWDCQPFIKKMANRIKKINASFIIPESKHTVQLSIIILTYNALEYTKLCLASILKNTKTDYELVIIDNNSDDGTKTWLSNEARRLCLAKRVPYTLVLNEENKGVAGGRNQGINLSKGNYCVFLDNDTEVGRGWENTMMNHFRFNPECWVVGNGGNYVDSYYPLRFHVIHSHLKIQSVDVVAGYCFMFPRKIIDLIGNQYMGLGKFWHEDLEFCGRVKAYGKQIILDTTIPIVHHGHKSAGKGNEDKIKEVHKGFNEKAKKVGKRLQSPNILTIYNDKNDNSAYSIIAQNITKYLREQGLIVLRKPRIEGFHTLRSPSFDLCNAFDMNINGISLTYQHSENNIAPRIWTEDIRLVDYALCCSEFAQQAIKKAGCQDSKVLCHSLTGIQDEYSFNSYPISNYEWGKIVGKSNEDKFVFLNVGASQPRKGQDLLIRAFAKAFEPDDDVVLVIKNYNYGKHTWLLEEINKVGDCPPIIPVYEDWSVEKMASVYKYVAENGAYIHPHRAEGVGMPILEALATGCRVGATDFGGIESLIGYKNLTKFSYELEPSTFHNNPAEPFYTKDENPLWAKPDMEEIMEYMLKITSQKYNPESARLDSIRLLREYSFEARAKSFYSFLKSLINC